MCCRRKINFIRFIMWLVLFQYRHGSQRLGQYDLLALRRGLWSAWENRQFKWWIVAYAVLCVSFQGIFSLLTTFEAYVLIWYVAFSPCRCAQCFRAFQDGIFYEFEGRKYCERDFHVLFAPCCNKCGEFVIGRVIKAMAASWHPQCFCCESCHKELADCGFIRNQVSSFNLCNECTFFRLENAIWFALHLFDL